MNGYASGAATTNRTRIAAAGGVVGAAPPGPPTPPPGAPLGHPRAADRRAHHNQLAAAQDTGRADRLAAGWQETSGI